MKNLNNSSQSNPAIKKAEDLFQKPYHGTTLVQLTNDQWEKFHKLNQSDRIKLLKDLKK